MFIMHFNYKTQNVKKKGIQKITLYNLFKYNTTILTVKHMKVEKSWYGIALLQRVQGDKSVLRNFMSGVMYGEILSINLSPSVRAWQ